MGTPESRAELASTLREEARDVLAQTGIFALLQHRFAEPMVTGSAAYDLMVWRDIDIDLPVDPELWREWIAFGGDLAAQLDSVGLTLNRATYINGHAEHHPVGVGLCWSIGFNDFAGFPWTIDIWGWDPFDYAVRQARDFSLKTDLQGLPRDLILRLKTEARERPHYYGVRIFAWDIYQFLLAKAGDSLSALESWKAKQ